jgi:cytochrome c-type protein NapB
MKLITKIGLSMAAATTLFLSGCNSQPDQAKADDTTSKKTDTTASVITSEKVVDGIGYGSVSLDDDSAEGTPGTEYASAAPGTSKKIKRAFQDAPPMIPHSVKDMLPITQNNNQCITCHVDSAPYDKSIPSVPVSHMTNFRPAGSIAIKHGNTSSEKLANVSIKKLNHLYQGRYNCSQCHAPQARNVDLITGSKFQADYTSKDGAFKSSWDDTKFMDGIDTTK